MSNSRLRGATVPLHECWPMPYTGLPGLLSSLGLVVVSLGPIASFLGDWNLAVSLSGVALLLLSVGREVRVCGDTLVLCYGFPVVLYRQVVGDIVEVADFREMSRGRLARYFRLPVAAFFVSALAFLAYLVARGFSVFPPYALYLLIPVVVCSLLLAYLVLTFSGFLKLLRLVTRYVWAVLWLATLFVVITYRKAYGHSILDDPWATAAWLLGVLILALFIAVLSAYAGRRPVVVIGDSRGRHYAIAAADEAAARRLIGVVSRVMAGGGGSA